MRNILTVLSLSFFVAAVVSHQLRGYWRTHALAEWTAGGLDHRLLLTYGVVLVQHRADAHDPYWKGLPYNDGFYHAYTEPIGPSRTRQVSAEVWVLPNWLLYLVGLAHPTMRVARWHLARRRLRRRQRLGLCLTCGYDLRGNTSGICSECGAPCAAAPP